MTITQTPAQVAASNRGGRPKPGKDPRSRDVQRWAKFMARLVRAYGKRAAEEDPWVVADMLAAQAQLDEQITLAVAHLVARGYDWATIGAELNLTKNAAYKRWAHLVAPLVPGLVAAMAEADEQS